MLCAEEAGKGQGLQGQWARSTWKFSTTSSMTILGLALCVQGEGGAMLLGKVALE